MASTLAQVEEAIKGQREFRLSDTLSGTTDSVGGTHGFLPEEYREDVESAVYVVISYDTPIAWVRSDGTKIVPDVGYSPTTSQHQYTVKAAWGITGRLSFPARGRTLRPAGGGPRRGGIDG